MNDTVKLLSSEFDTKNTNVFHVEKEFFIIDSDKLQDVKTRLYGFSLQNSGIYENDNLTQSAAEKLNGCGIYVYVEVKDGKILIQQDFNGSYGIYLFQKDERFILSNSFLRLLEYVKKHFPLSLNRDYANHFLTESLVNSVAYSETPIQEITVIDKDAFIEIDIEDKSLDIQLLDYQYASISLNSAEGLAVLDRWFLRWTTIFQKLKEQTNQIAIDLSGGFDSRIIFLLVLQSGINLNEILVNSINDTLHTHKEDYEIASEIANYYGFELNNHNIFLNSSIPHSMEDTLNISFYTKMGFHKEMYFKGNKHEFKRYRIPGSGGESIRAYWDISAQEFADKMCNATNRYPKNIQDDLIKSIRSLIDSAYKIIKKKHKIADDNSKDYPVNMYREIRSRGHFGKSSVENYFSNTYDLSPYIDPDLLKLRLNDPECMDNNLLMAVIYTRYCPKLLEFKFEGGRSIDPATIEFSRKLNEKFGGNVLHRDTEELCKEFHVSIKDPEVSRLKSHNVNSFTPASTLVKYLKSVFDSTGFQKLFATYFNEDIYYYANTFFENNSFHPMRYCYAVIAVTKVIEDVITSQNSFFPSLVQSMDRFICENHYEADKDTEVIERFKDHITARFDFKLFGIENPNFEVTSASDSKAKISMPKWLQKDGIGYMIESYTGKLDLSFRSATGGNLKIWVRAKDMRDKNGNKLHHWIDYQNIQYNDDTIPKTQSTVSHDHPIYLNYPVEAGEIIRFHAEWMPYKGDYKISEEHAKQLGTIRKSLKQREDKINGLQQEIINIKNSYTFRIGHKIMYFPRKFKKLFK